MLKRLVLGLLVGALIGALVAAAAIGGLHFDVWPNVVFAYVFAAATGAATGLLAGKPIWAKGAMIEAWLKAFFGALLAVGGMFALSKWGGDSPLDLAQLHVAKDALAHQPATSLPVISAVLGAVFGLDNTPEPEGTTKTRVGARTRVAESDGDEVAENAPSAAKKRAN